MTFYLASGKELKPTVKRGWFYDNERIDGKQLGMKASGIQHDRSRGFLLLDSRLQIIDLHGVKLPSR